MFNYRFFLLCLVATSGLMQAVFGLMQTEFILG